MGVAQASCFTQSCDLRPDTIEECYCQFAHAIFITTYPGLGSTWRLLLRAQRLPTGSWIEISLDCPALGTANWLRVVIIGQKDIMKKQELIPSITVKLLMLLFRVSCAGYILLRKSSKSDGMAAGSIHQWCGLTLMDCRDKSMKR